MKFQGLGIVGISSGRLLAITIVTSGTLAWFFVVDQYFRLMFQGSLESELWLSVGRALFYGFGALSAIIGALLSTRVNRKKLLGLWIGLGIIATGSIFIVQGFLFSLILTIFLGISLGLGFPCSMALLADSTDIGQRGRVSGIVIFETFVLVVVAIFAGSFLSFGLTGVVLTCIALRATSLFALLSDSFEKQKGKEQPWFSILRQKNFAFYVFPWMMFNVASGLTNFVWYGLRNSPDFIAVYDLGSSLQFAGTVIVCIISGLMADRFGRKQPIFVGVVLFAISYAILGIATNFWSILVHFTTLGIAWGFLMVVYLAIPGDLARNNSQERYYALATILPLVVYMSLSSLPQVLDLNPPVNILSPILSVILILSLIPIWYASETLPATKIKERRLSEHLKKVGELISESDEPQ